MTRSLRRRSLLHWSLIDRTRTGLRSNHSSLGNNRLLRGRLGWRLRGWRCSAGCRLRWWCRRFGSRCLNRSRSRRRGWRYHNRWRRNGFFLRWHRRRAGYRWRWRRLRRGRCNHDRWRCRPGDNRRGLLGCRRRGRRFAYRRRWRCRGTWRRRSCCRLGRSWWLMLLLFALSEQFENITGFGDPRQIQLRFDLGLARPLLPARRRFGRKILANLFGFVVLYRA